MPIVRKGKELLVTFRCKLGYHEWVAVHSYEYRQRPRRAIFSHTSLIREVERKLSIIPKEKPNIIVITVGRRKDENNKSV